VLGAPSLASALLPAHCSARSSLSVLSAERFSSARAAPAQSLPRRSTARVSALLRRCSLRLGMEILRPRLPGPAVSRRSSLPSSLSMACLSPCVRRARSLLQSLFGVLRPSSPAPFSSDPCARSFSPSQDRPCALPSPSSRLALAPAMVLHRRISLSSARSRAPRFWPDLAQLGPSRLRLSAPAARPCCACQLVCCAREFSLLAGAFARLPVRCRDCHQIIGVAQLINRILVGHQFHIRHGPHVSRPYPNLPARRLTVVFLEIPCRPTSRLSSSRRVCSSIYATLLYHRRSCHPLFDPHLTSSLQTQSLHRFVCHQEISSVG
jgi:hypothetical protein